MGGGSWRGPFGDIWPRPSPQLAPAQDGVTRRVMEVAVWVGHSSGLDMEVKARVEMRPYLLSDVA
jgi:hypothetical protein